MRRSASASLVACASAIAARDRLQQPRQLRRVHPREPLHEFGDMCRRLRLVVLDERIFAPFPIPTRPLRARWARRSLWFSEGDAFQVPSTPL